MPYYAERCVWDLWSDWSICSVDPNACGPPGFKTRTRQVLKDAAHGGKPCEGKSMEIEDCGGRPMEECKGEKNILFFYFEHSCIK